MEFKSEEQQQIPEQLESIKLTKNAKGIFQWEIKLKSEELMPQDLVRLNEINEDLEKQYGNKGQNNDISIS